MNSFLNNYSFKFLNNLIQESKNNINFSNNNNLTEPFSLNFNYQKQYEELEEEITFVIGILAIIFNSLGIIIFFICCCLGYNKKGFELITYMNIASLINVISHMIYYRDDESSANNLKCDLQGHLMVYSEQTLLLSASVLTYNVYKDVLSREHVMRGNDRLINILTCFIIPIFLIAIGHFLKIFGINGHWCWIKEEKNYYILGYYILIWVYIISNITLIILSYRRVKKNQRRNSYVEEDEIEGEISLIKRMSIFPIMLFICWIFPTVDRFLFYVKNDHCDIIEILRLIGILSLGIMISIFSFIFIFGTNFLILIRRCCLKNKKQLNTDTQTNLINES